MEGIGDAEIKLHFVKTWRICGYFVPSSKIFDCEWNKNIVQKNGWEIVMARR